MMDKRIRTIGVLATKQPGLVAVPLAAFVIVLPTVQYTLPKVRRLHLRSASLMDYSPSGPLVDHSRSPLVSAGQGVPY